MNKDFYHNLPEDMKLKKGDIIYYKHNTSIKREEHTNEMRICSFAGKTIGQLEDEEQIEILKVERPIKWKNVYEHKEILDEQEKDYLGKVIEPFKKRVIRIEKIKTLYGNSEFINIVLYNSISYNKEESIQLPYFKKGTMYKGMKRDKKYTLKELGLD